MTTPADVVDAAIPMASGSRMERARAGLRALGLFGQLSAGDKRDLAVLVAQRVAPELVPRIRSEGGVDLTDEQSRAVLDMVRRLDGDDLRELSEAVATPESRRRALAAVGGAAAGATGLDDVVAEPRPGSQPEPQAKPRPESRPEPRAEPRAVPPAELDEDTERLRIQVEALQRQCDELRDELAEHEAARRAAESAGEHAERELEDVRRHLEEATERADREARAAEQAVADRHAMEERLGRARDRAAARPGATTAAAAPASGGPAGASITPVVPVTTRGDEVDRLVRRLRDARASQAQRLVVLAAPAVAGMERSDRRRTLQAVPDGWARQRALQRLVEAGAVPRDEAADLLGLLGSNGSQVFAAGTMVTAGLVGADDLVDVLEPGAVIRLRRRAGGS